MDAVNSGLLTDESGRNDIVQVAVFGDAENIWLRVETAENITAPCGEHWMNVLLGTGGGWNGLEYAVNRKIEGTKSRIFRLEQRGPGWRYADSANTAEVHTEGSIDALKAHKSTMKVQ